MNFSSLLVMPLIFGAEPANPPQTPEWFNVPRPIQSVAVDTDKRTLVVTYDVAGAVRRQRITLPGAIADFRYCRWLGDIGIAVVARIGEKEKSEYFVHAIVLGDKESTHAAVKLTAPAEEFRVLGIGNTEGDSIVVMAMKQSRIDPETVSGWMYVNNCPHFYISDLSHVVVPFPAVSTLPPTLQKQ